MTLNDLLLQAASRGLRIHNLFQTADGRWQCNLRPAGDDGKGQRFAVAPTAAEALAQALSEMPTDNVQKMDIFS